MLTRLFASGDSRFAKVAITAERKKDGSIVLQNKIKLRSYPETLLAPLRHCAREQPDATFLAERAGEGWSSISYKEFLRRAEDRADQILALGCNAKRPLLILSQNSIEHALTAFAAMIVGVPASPVSPAYATASSFERLQRIIGILQPGAVYIGDLKTFARALPAITEAANVPIVSHISGENVKAFSAIVPADKKTAAAARASVKADTVAKVLFTSGSTGVPKGVINTHRMLCSNQAALAQLWPFLEKKPPVLVDWLPWSHTFGGNACFNAALVNGGTIYIDDGRPAPALIGRTIENIKMSPPNIYYNVPAGYEALLPKLESDEAFAKVFFGEVQAIFVAGAALPQLARERLGAIALRTTGRAPTLVSGWGSTETAPFATCVYFPTDSAANLGLPMPGTAIKMTPSDGRMALRVKGPNVTPGYWNNDDATAKAFDDEGFYDMGDAGRLLDPADPKKGIAFDGRLGENFKLTSGTWVNVGMLRVAIVDQLRPLGIDAVITGENREDIGVLVVPNFAQAAELAGVAQDVLAPEGMAACAFGEKIGQAIAEYNVRQTGGSTAIKRLAILPRAPDIARHEITDKGYINQRSMLTSYADVIAAMHGGDYSRDREFGILRF